MNLPAWFAVLWMALATALIAQPQSPDEIASQILAPLLDPARIATLKGDRPVNTRLYRILGWLETARLTGGNPDKIISTAQAIHGSSNTRRAVADRVAILRSWKELERFGCFTPQGITTVKKGRSPTITRGEHAGDSIHIDHILPRSIAPELDSRFYNLIPVSSKVNQRKGAKITAKELKLAERWNRQGLLFREGLATLRAANATGALSTSRTGALLK